MPDEELENQSTDTTDSSKKPGKAKAIDLGLLTAALATVLASPDGRAIFESAAAAFFDSPDGAVFLDDLISHRLPKPTLVELPETQPTTSTSVDTNQFARLFGIPATDIFNCRHYADEGRYVVVTVDGRKLEMSQAEADHAA